MRSNLERVGKVALVRYAGGVQGEPPVDTTDGVVRRIELGAGCVPIAFENALFDMEVGERRAVVMDPDLAFGRYDERLAFTMLRSMLPNGDALKEGSILVRPNPLTGEPLPAHVTKATRDYVMLDQNHPWAGKVLEYDVELVGLE